jgi:hypothetical protein
MPDGWQEVEVAQQHRPVITSWAGPGGEAVSLHEDGLIATSGEFPVELLGHVLCAWAGFLKGKVS